MEKLVRQLLSSVNVVWPVDFFWILLPTLDIGTLVPALSW